MEHSLPEPDQPFVSDEDIDALKNEADVLGHDFKDLAERVFEEHLPSAVLAICQMARHAQSERVRLSAAQYVVERNLGRLQDSKPLGSEDPLEEIVRTLQEEDSSK